MFWIYLLLVSFLVGVFARIVVEALKPNPTYDTRSSDKNYYDSSGNFTGKGGTHNLNGKQM